MFHSYRSGKQPISDKAWRKLEAAEKRAGLTLPPPPNAENLTKPKDVLDPQMQKTLAAARDFNEALAPAQRRLVRDCLRQLDYYLSGIAENDAANGLPASLLGLSHERLDQFAKDAQALRESAPQEAAPEPES